MSFGVMGGDMQPQGQTQIIVNRVDYGLEIQSAGDAPRWHHEGEGGGSRGRRRHAHAIHRQGSVF